MNGLPDLAPEAKAQALEEVLKSEAFLRSDQLRSFLRFICEMEVSGRAAEISEYSIAVRALGRPAGFVPSEDTIVRNRAHALRQRLASFYAKEGSGSTVRIELAKGSYVPRFLSIPLEARGSQNRLERKRISKIGIGLVAGAVVLGAVLSVMLIARLGSSGADRTLREAWGPLAASDGDAISSAGNPRASSDPGLSRRGAPIERRSRPERSHACRGIPRRTIATAQGRGIAHAYVVFAQIRRGDGGSGRGEGPGFHGGRLSSRPRHGHQAVYFAKPQRDTDWRSHPDPDHRARTATDGLFHGI